MADYMTRAEAMDWHDGWSTADRVTIMEELDRLGIDRFEKIDSDTYIRLVNTKHGRVGHLNRGYLDFAPGYGPRHAQLANNGWSYLPFTCHRLRVRPGDEPTLVGQTAPVTA